MQMSARQTASMIDLRLKGFKEELVKDIRKLIKEELDVRASTKRKTAKKTNGSKGESRSSK